MGRYQELFRSAANLYIEGSPVIIVAGAIQKDTTNDSILAQLKICNISLKNIISCSVLIKAYEVNGNEIDGVIDYSYLDINVGSGKDFGSKNAIVLSNYKTRRINVSIVEIVFSDGEVWKNDNWDWQPLAEQNTLEKNYSDPEIIKQIKMETKNVAKMMPTVDRNIISCICGSKNLLTNGSCYNCKFDFNELSRVFDEEYLKQQKNERIERERLEREQKLEQERIKQEEKLEQERVESIKREEARLQREKKKKKTIIMAIIAVAIIIVAIITVPIIKSMVTYNNAQKLMASEQYDDAISIFTGLGDYKDSSDYLLEAKYLKASKWVSNDQFDEAINAYSELNGYKDSEEQINEANYLKANMLADEKKYEDALALYRQLGDYKDSMNIIENIEFEKIINSKVDDIVIFGDYNGDSEWIVLENTGSKVLLISKNVMELKAYNEVYKPVSWSECTLRKWLNDDFYNETFNENDKEKIIKVNNESSEDYVFILYKEEAQRYLRTNARSVSKNLAKDAYMSWWLRVKDNTSNNTSGVSEDGYVQGKNISVNKDNVGVRPVIWVDITEQKDSEQQVIECEEEEIESKYNTALSLKNNGSYEEAIAKLKELNGYKDSEQQIVECEDLLTEKIYNEALSFVNDKDYISAGKLFSKLGNYKDSKEQYRQIALKIAKYGDVGDILCFGKYEWKILAKEDNKVLIMTADSVINKEYNTKYVAVTWEQCSLRRWLNNEFYNEFNSEEKSIILISHLANNNNPKYGTNGGSPTEDKIFVLSLDEFIEYISVDSSITPGNVRCLRTPGYDEKTVMTVDHDFNYITESECDVNDDMGVCPAMWISLE